MVGIKRRCKKFFYHQPIVFTQVFYATFCDLNFSLTVESHIIYKIQTLWAQIVGQD